MDEARTATWRGRTVRWSTLGCGPPVVLCHGTPWSSEVWRPAAERLAADHTVFLWDMPGYGSSSRDPEHAVDLATQAETLTWLLDEWELSGPHVVAHDIGGAVALRAHLLHQVGFASLALVDAVVCRPWGSPFYLLLQEHSEVFAQLPAAMHRALLREYVGGASPGGVLEDRLTHLVDPWLGASQPSFYRQVAQVRHEHTDEVEPLLASVRCRTCVFWGEEDTWLPVEQGRDLATRLPGATCRTYAGAGHLLPLERPDDLAADLLDWLAQGPRPSRGVLWG